MGKLSDEMRLEYMGLEFLYLISPCKISQEDQRIFDEWSSYLNDVLSVNFYNYPAGTIESEFKEGSREMRAILRKYGVNESEFDSENLQLLGMIFEITTKVLYDSAENDLKESIRRLANAKIETTSTEKKKELREMAKKEGIVL